MKIGNWKPKPHPFEPSEWDEDILMAFRSFVAGKANDGQQALVWKYVQYLSGVGEYQDLSWRPGGPDGERQTSFAEGKRFVGLQLLKLLHPDALEAIERERAKQRGKR